MQAIVERPNMMAVLRKAKTFYEFIGVNGDSLQIITTYSLA